MKTPAKLLFENNPFYTSAAADPWENRLPDVESINRSAFDGICQVAKNKSKNPKQPVAAIVLGEAGSGKTHLLKRILKSTQNDGQNTIFIFVKPILNPHAPMRHMLKDIITDISRKTSDTKKCSKIHLLVAEILKEFLLSDGVKPELILELEENPCLYFEEREDLGSILESVRKKAINHINNEIPSINRNFLKVLFRINEGENYWDVVNWLKGEIIDEEMSKILGVPNRESMYDEALEEEAREIIISLGKLMERYNRLMIVCFDQLDNLKSAEQIEAFGNMVHTLTNNTFAILPITFVRADSWNNRFKTILEIPVVERLGMNIYVLSGCSLDQADEIVKVRTNFYLPDRWEEPYKWLSSELEGRIKEGYSPRQVINLANHVIQSAHSAVKPVEIPDLLQKHYLNECDTILADFEGWPPDCDRLEFALEHFLSNQSYAKTIEKSKGKKVTLTGLVKTPEKTEKQVAFITNISENHSSVRSCFEHGIKYMQNTADAVCYYITDPRCTITKPGWKATCKKRTEFERNGGIILQPAKNEIARWYALTSLIFKVTEGDISAEKENGILREVSEKELSDFINTESCFGAPLIDFQREIQIENGGGKKADDVDNPELILDDIVKIVKESPMNVIGINLLCGKLLEIQHNITYEELLGLIGKKQDLFSIYPSKQGSMVMLLEYRK